ncbi:unnamed protein product [Gongylonema pulchrum]|uniref:Zf-AD domain-containing protein n=1 Tax=Gongylonema pulchrum TaxID=637853 RepID=A0A183DU42_9BILA|nr:unnamed protein product [Gongylonema pulchrum]
MQLMSVVVPEWQWSTTAAAKAVANNREEPVAAKSVHGSTKKHPDNQLGVISYMKNRANAFKNLKNTSKLRRKVASTGCSILSRCGALRTKFAKSANIFVPILRNFLLLNATAAHFTRYGAAQAHAAYYSSSADRKRPTMETGEDHCDFCIDSSYGAAQAHAAYYSSSADRKRPTMVTGEDHCDFCIDSSRYPLARKKHNIVDNFHGIELEAFAEKTGAGGDKNCGKLCKKCIFALASGALANY